MTGKTHLTLGILIGVIAKVVVHRSITHYLITPIILFLIFVSVSIITRISIIYSVSFFVGYASHILEDAMTRSGVSLFYPFYKKSIHLLPEKYRFRTGVVVTKEEYLLIGIMTLISIVILVTNYTF